MKYSILFGGNAAVSFEDSADFLVVLAKSEGVTAVQKSDETQTVTLKLGDEQIAEAIRNDINALAQELLKEPVVVEPVAETVPDEPIVDEGKSEEAVT